MPQPAFTWQEVAEHNTPASLWVSYNKKVYDVTSFVDVHPGGRDQLVAGAGRDVTCVFNSYHKNDTHKMLSKYYIGELSTSEQPSFPPPSKFATTIKDRVAKYFADNKQDPKSAPWMIVRYFTIVTVMLSAKTLSIYFADNRLFSVFFCFVFGIFSAFNGLMTLHDASHYAITHNPKIWKFFGLLHEVLNGVSLYVWINQHCFGHHPFTNIDGHDPDINTGAPLEPEVLRIKKSQSWFQRYLGQHIYMPFFYALISHKMRIQDWTIFFGKNEVVRLNPPSKLEWFYFYLGKASFTMLHVVIPMFFVSPVKALELWWTAEMFASTYIVLLFLCSHVVGEVEWPHPNKNFEMEYDWSELQIRATTDYATDSKFTTFITGALNHQTAHHLFPGVNQYHYMKITPIIKETCKEFGIPYHYQPTLIHALGGHFSHLYSMGRPPKEHSN